MTATDDSGLATSVHTGSPAPTDPAPAGQRPQLTQTQTRDLLGEIADSAQAIALLAISEDAQVAMPAIHRLANLIGLLADYAIGNDAVYSSPIDWLLGPEFSKQATREGGAA